MSISLRQVRNRKIICTDNGSILRTCLCAFSHSEIMLLCRTARRQPRSNAAIDEATSSSGPCPRKMQGSVPNFLVVATRAHRRDKAIATHGCRLVDQRTKSSPCVQRSALSCTRTHLAGRGTETFSKGPIERGETIEAPGIGDVGDGTIPVHRTCEGRTTFLKPPGLDMLRKTFSGRLEEKMQLPDGNFDSGGCLRGCQPGVRQMFRYVIFRLLQLGGPNCPLLRAR